MNRRWEQRQKRLRARRNRKWLMMAVTASFVLLTAYGGAALATWSLSRLYGLPPLSVPDPIESLLVAHGPTAAGVSLTDAPAQEASATSRAASATPPVATARKGPVPEFWVEGLQTASGGLSSGAIIGYSDGPVAYYRIGDEVAAGFFVAAVKADQVILERSGEQLPLYLDMLGMGSYASRGGPLRVNTPEEFISLAERRLDADPLSALLSVGLDPVADEGEPAGYYYNGNNGMLATLNLKEGDVLLAVNGYTLGNVAEDRELISSIYQEGELSIEVERDGTLFTVYYSF